MSSNTKSSDKGPIFIHSLFRAGSTYLFSTFRVSPAGYCCFQEPLHEIAVFSRENPAVLKLDNQSEKAAYLRHDIQGGDYFAELYSAWPEWKESLSEEAIYDSYFAPEGQDIGIDYWKTLVNAANGRPVFQECRTSGRIAAIKENLGGYHIYLWRNPWDQWWSYKVDPYFDTANQLIINAKNRPAALHKLLDELDLEAYEGSDIEGAFSFYGARPPSIEGSYLIFYMLWCHGIRDGWTDSNLMLSIDRLSDSTAYQQEISDELDNAGIPGIDLHECKVPQGKYLDREMEFFAPLEARVHTLLLEHGWHKNDIKKIEDLRTQFQPKMWSKSPCDIDPDDVTIQASRARELALRHEDRSSSANAKALENSALANQAQQREEQSKAREAALYSRFEKSTSSLQEAQQFAQGLQQRISDLSGRLAEAENKSDRLRQRENEMLGQLKQVFSSLQQTQASFAQSDARVSDLLKRTEKLDDKVDRLRNRETELIHQLRDVIEEKREATQISNQLENRVANLEARLAQENEEVKRLHLSEAKLQDQLNSALDTLHKVQKISMEFETRAVSAETRLAEISAELEAARLELDDAHKSNHNHWLELQETRKQLQKEQESSHWHWQVAEQRHQYIQALLKSSSWRITAPLRQFTQFTKWLFRFPAMAVVFLARQPRNFLRWMAIKLILFVGRDDRRKNKALSILRRMPSVGERLRSFVYDNGVMIHANRTAFLGNEAEKQSTNQEHYREAVSRLPLYHAMNPHARRIYKEIREVSERQSGENV